MGLKLGMDDHLSRSGSEFRFAGASAQGSHKWVACTLVKVPDMSGIQGACSDE